jgi:hypoxanthine phosphoribosyltransferase
VLNPLFHKKEIENTVKRLATEIEKDFNGEEIIFVCLLKGSFIFLSDLIRHIKLPSRVDFMRVSSYGGGMESTGKIDIKKDLEEDIEGKNIIIVEDIIDSGLTLKTIKDLLLARNPKSIKICALIDKRAKREVKIEGDYIGFTIDDGFVVGYGIDYAEQYRNLPDICIVERAVSTSSPNPSMPVKAANPDNMIKKEEAILVIIDIQERLVPVISNREVIIENILRLIKFSHIINIPVVITEQERLGPTLTELKQELPNIKPIEKGHFNCFFSDEFLRVIEDLGRKSLVLTGVETHICVAQTALYAAASDFNVHVVSDAVSSRIKENWQIAIDRMRQAGVTISTTEMLIYELLQKAGTPEFKLTLPLVK